jgi:hypothetical protein
MRSLFWPAVWYGIGVGLILLVLFGCAAQPLPLPDRPSAASWDQENLKRNDHGCPTAIFIAPEGVLEECP